MNKLFAIAALTIAVLLPAGAKADGIQLKKYIDTPEGANPAQQHAFVIINHNLAYANYLIMNNQLDFANGILKLLDNCVNTEGATCEPSMFISQIATMCESAVATDDAYATNGTAVWMKTAMVNCIMRFAKGSTASA